MDWTRSALLLLLVALTVGPVSGGDPVPGTVGAGASHLPRGVAREAAAKQETDAGAPAPPEATNDLSHGIWISRADLMTRPTQGKEWRSVVHAAQDLIPAGANVSDRDSSHDVQTLAAALAGVRLDHAGLKNAAVAALHAAVGTELGGDWLAASRNMTAYTVAADVLRSDGIVLGHVDAWLHDFLDGTIQLPLNKGEVGSGVRSILPFASGSNASAQEGALYVALAAYLNDHAALEYGWERFRVYVGDRPVTSVSVGPAIGQINIEQGIASGWSHDPSAPLPINPRGASKSLNGVPVDIGGIIINDQRRGGSFTWPPGYTKYPWVGLEGAVPAALILYRSGYPAFAAGDDALLRAAEAMWRLGEELGQDPTCTEGCWWDYDRATDVKHLVNWYYARNYPHEEPVGPGRTMGFTDWTHPSF